MTDFIKTDHVWSGGTGAQQADCPKVVECGLHSSTEAPPYLREHCCPIVAIKRHISLCSSVQAELLVPRSRTVIRQRRAFSVAGPTAWNGLPVALRLTPVAHSALFLSGLKTTLFDRVTEVGLGALLSRLP